MAKRKILGELPEIANRGLELDPLEDRLGVDSDQNIYADNHPTVFHVSIPVHAELVPVDAGLCSEPNAGVAEGRPPLAQVANVQRYPPGDASDGEVAGDFVLSPGGWLDLSALEGDSRVMFDVQEVCTMQVGIPFRFVCPEFGGVDTYLQRSILGMLGIELQPTLNVFEVTPNVGHHHVPHGKFRGGMTCFKFPSRHSATSCHCDCDTKSRGTCSRGLLEKKSRLVSQHRVEGRAYPAPLLPSHELTQSRSGKLSSPMRDYRFDTASILRL